MVDGKIIPSFESHAAHPLPNSQIFVRCGHFDQLALFRRICQSVVLNKAICQFDENAHVCGFCSPVAPFAAFFIQSFCLQRQALATIRKCLAVNQAINQGIG